MPHHGPQLCHREPAGEWYRHRWQGRDSRTIKVENRPRQQGWVSRVAKACQHTAIGSQFDDRAGKTLCQVQHAALINHQIGGRQISRKCDPFNQSTISTETHNTADGQSVGAGSGIDSIDGTITPNRNPLRCR